MMSEDSTFYNQIPEKSQKIADAVRTHMMAVNKIDQKNFQAANLKDYRNFCFDYLKVEEPILDDDIRSKLNRVIMCKNLRGIFREHHRFCVTIIPCSRYGNALENSAIKNKEYYKELVISSEGKTVGGFTIDDSNIYDLIPKEIQRNCSFDVGTFDPVPADKNNFYPYDLAPNDRARIIAEYEKILKNAKIYFSMKQTLVTQS